KMVPCGSLWPFSVSFVVSFRATGMTKISHHDRQGPFRYPAGDPRVPARAHRARRRAAEPARDLRRLRFPPERDRGLPPARAGGGGTDRADPAQGPRPPAGGAKNGVKNGVRVPFPGESAGPGSASAEKGL